MGGAVGGERVVEVTEEDVMAVAAATAVCTHQS